MLPRVTAFPILPEGHLVYKASTGLRIPAREKTGCPLIGNLAPEIILRDQLGRDCSLHATIELGRPIVLFFFPLAGSPQCTVESCSFRDALGDSAVFAELDAIVIGISQDTPETLRRFVDEHDLGYIILSDAKREAMQAFGVNKTWLGLINNRCTFVIDHEGIVRGMCEGVLDAKGHNQFAERWLVRIEHELAGRTKERMLDDDEEHGAVKTMATDEASGKRIKHGRENSAKGAGIDQAPRYGAAPRTTPTGSLKAKKSNGVRDFLAQFSSPDGHPLPALGGATYVKQMHSQPLTPSSSQDKSSEKAPSRFRNVFRGGRKGTPPPVPPTYENFDEDIRMYGQTDSVGSGSGSGSGSAERMTASGSTGSHREAADRTSLKSSGSGSRSTRDTSSSQHRGHSRNASVGSSTKVPTYDSVAPIVSLKSKPTSSSTNDGPAVPAKDFAMPSRRPQVAETGDLSNGTVTHGMDRLSVQDDGAIPRRSRDAPDDVPMDATDDADDSEEFVTQLANGQIEVIPREQRFNVPISSIIDPAPPMIQAPPRTTSRAPASAQSSSGSRPGSARSLADRSVNGSPRGKQSTSRRGSEEDFGRRTPNGRGTPTALGPPPPRPTSRSAQRQQQAQAAAQAPLSRASLESLGGAQIQSAKRTTIHKDATQVSPRRGDSYTSVTTARPRMITPRTSPRVDAPPPAGSEERPSSAAVRQTNIPKQAPVPTHPPPPVPGPNGNGSGAEELGTSPRSLDSLTSSSNHSLPSLSSQRRPSDTASIASVGTFGRRVSVAEVMQF